MTTKNTLFDHRLLDKPERVIRTPRTYRTTESRGKLPSAKRDPFFFCTRRKQNNGIQIGCAAELCSDTRGALPSGTNLGCIIERAEEIDICMPYIGSALPNQGTFGYRGCIAEPQQITKYKGPLGNTTPVCRGRQFAPNLISPRKCCSSTWEILVEHLGSSEPEQ